jgi:hypothetical protein
MRDGGHGCAGLGEWRSAMLGLEWVVVRVFFYCWAS